ncbi:MAG: hypothetical protein K940chlam5_00681 [Candidatus Anoxychlamydiales bacterium]|nr:hypothetical protein [Candidatus Anoxychlamydiales bacterium]
MYVPIHDIQGNVACAISSNNDIETYRYSAFGEEKIFKNKVEYPESQIKNNWRFSSKRKDESNLIYFGRRYYDTDYGRWVTPDPGGFKDGLNLYAFVLNDPLIKVDLYGLEFLAYNPDSNFYKAMDRASGKSPSRAFDLNKKEISPNKRIYFSNGIYNSFKEAGESAEHLSKMANNSNIYGIYNEHLGKGSDILRAGMSLMFGISSKASKLIANEWVKYLDKDEKNKILHFCHSESALNTRIALDRIDKSYRERIGLVAIAPAGHISKTLVNEARHYASKRDFVHLIDNKGFMENYDNIVTLPPSPSAKMWDHNFMSPTYAPSMKQEIDDFIK